jgi:hypothetical protein
LAQITPNPGFNYVIFNSTNLVDWVPIVTNVSPFSYVETNAALSLKIIIALFTRRRSHLACIFYGTSCLCQAIPSTLDTFTVAA